MYNATTSSYMTGGTGTALPRNTTMSMATLTASSTDSSLTGRPRGGTATTGGSYDPSMVMSTGGASVLGSSPTLILGAFAAMVYFN